MTPDTIPAIALCYIAAVPLYTFWLGFATVLDIIDSSAAATWAAIAFIACLAIVINYLRVKDQP